MVKQISKLVTERDSLNGIMLVTSNKELLGISNGIPPGFLKKTMRQQGPNIKHAHFYERYTYNVCL